MRESVYGGAVKKKTRTRIRMLCGHRATGLLCQLVKEDVIEH